MIERSNKRGGIWKTTIRGNNILYLNRQRAKKKEQDSERNFGVAVKTMTLCV